MSEPRKLRQSGNGKQLCPCNCHWDLSWLRFGDSRIAASDCDGLFVVERTGHFLFIETKTDDEPMTMGQEILLRALSVVPRFTVLVLRGPKGYPTSCTRITGIYLERTDTSRDDFQVRVDRWFRVVNQRPVFT